MSCFDTVKFACPSCGCKFDVQSKAVLRILKTYNHTSVPIDIAASLDSDIESCPSCEENLRIVANIPKRVALYLETVEQTEDEDFE